MSETWLSPAKINRFLHIISKRSDGYHNIQTIFQLLNYGDEIKLKTRNDGAINRIYGNEHINKKDDLLIKSAKLLQQKTNTKQGIDIGILKKIPIGGGLGGGSSNAATVLVALNHLWQTKLTQTELINLGSKLGADVPVFIFGKSSWAEGTGDKLQDIKLPQNYFLIISCNKNISTKDVFNNSLLTINTRQLKISDFFIAKKSNLFSNNCLEAAIFQEREIIKVINWLNTFFDGEKKAKMTGTGCCVFAQFLTKKEAINVLNKLPKKWTGFVAKGVNSLDNKLTLCE